MASEIKKRMNKDTLQNPRTIKTVQIGKGSSYHPSCRKYPL